MGYVRVSTNEQGLSVTTQETRIRWWTNAYNYQLVDLIVDKNISGSVPLAERPGGKRVAAMIDSRRRPPADTLVVCNLDRLTRNAEDGIALVQRMTPNGSRRHHLGLVSIDQHLDLTGPFGVFMAQQFVVFASFERSLIGWRTKQALAQRKRDGKVYGGVRFGWDHTDDGHLVLNQTEQAVLDQMRAWRAEGVNDNQIARRLNDAQIKGKSGGRWQAVTVYRILAADEIGAA